MASRRYLWRKGSSVMVLMGIGLLFYYGTMSSIAGSSIKPDLTRARHSTRHTESPNSTFKPLEADQPVFVLVLGYQRTASNLISTVLRDFNDQFFFFEPLDMTFTALYGTGPSLSVPSEIFNDAEGNMREHQDEQLAIQFTLDTIFQCSMSEKWPIQFLMHSFTLYRGADGYPTCVNDRVTANKTLSRTGTEHALENCLLLIETLCVGRFIPGSAKLEKCKRMMFTNQQFRTAISKGESFEGFTRQEVKMFDEYYKCLNGYDKIARECAKEHLDKPCLESSTRVVKTTRATMDGSRVFFERYRNFRLIHLFRDARGAVGSRLDAKWSKGGHEGQGVSNIAKLYCQNVYSDYSVRKTLEKQYPGQILQVISDDFMLHSDGYVDKIAKLLAKNAIFKQEVTRRLALNGITVGSDNDTSKGNYAPTRHNLGKEGESRIQYWKESLTFNAVHDIQTACVDFYRGIPHDWPFMIL